MISKGCRRFCANLIDATIQKARVGGSCASELSLAERRAVVQRARFLTEHMCPTGRYPCSIENGCGMHMTHRKLVAYENQLVGLLCDDFVSNVELMSALPKFDDPGVHFALRRLCDELAFDFPIDDAFREMEI